MRGAACQTHSLSSYQIWKQLGSTLRILVDPAWLYGCTTRTLYDAELENRLPTGRTHIAVFNVEVAHPVDWSLSQLDDNTYALAPKTVTRGDLQALEGGGDGPPMLVLQRFEQPFMTRLGRDYPILIDDPWEPFTIGYGKPHRTAARNAITLYYPATRGFDPDNDETYAPAEGIHAAVVSTHADFAVNEPLYVDMLTYLETRQFWLSPDLRHTLFMDGLQDLIAIGYPEGWVETLDSQRNRVIAPADAVTLMMRLMSVKSTHRIGIRRRTGCVITTPLTPRLIYIHSCHSRPTDDRVMSSRPITDARLLKSPRRKTATRLTRPCWRPLRRRCRFSYFDED